MRIPKEATTYFFLKKKKLLFLISIVLLSGSGGHPALRRVRESVTPYIPTEDFKCCF